jgi:hypothetical protein
MILGIVRFNRACRSALKTVSPDTKSLRITKLRGRSETQVDAIIVTGAGVVVSGEMIRVGGQQSHVCRVTRGQNLFNQTVSRRQVRQKTLLSH